VTELSWRAFISAMLESISERLLMSKDDKRTPLDHMSEVLDGLIHCQDVGTLRTILLLGRAGLMEVETERLPSVANTMLQGGAHCHIGSVYKYGQSSR
jgi:hypothetical protein